MFNGVHLLLKVHLPLDIQHGPDEDRKLNCSDQWLGCLLGVGPCSLVHGPRLVHALVGGHPHGGEGGGARAWTVQWSGEFPIFCKMLPPTLASGF